MGDAEDCLPAGLLGSFLFLGWPLQSPSLSHPLRNTQEFQVQGFLLLLGNVLLTYLLSNNPVGSGILLPLPTFSASETFLSSLIHVA